MVGEIRIYVEGGGDQNFGMVQLRDGFNSFLSEAKEAADSKNIDWQIIPCGGRRGAYKKFCNALEDHPDAFNILLVDSEEKVEYTPWKHLKNRKHDEWEKPESVDEDNCQLMVQIMESWFLADIEALAGYFGENFDESALPADTEIENIGKDSVILSLNKAALKTVKKRYHKIKDGTEILKIIDVAKVRAAAPHCERLFSTLEQKIGE